MRTTSLHTDWLDLLRCLVKHQVRFLMIGGHAVSLHSEPRYTEDLDLFVEATLANGRRLRKALVEFGLGNVAPKPEELAKPGPFWMFGRKPIRIDLLTEIPAVSSFRAAWKGRVEVDIDGILVPVIGREDLIANKRGAGRAKDLADVESLVRFPANEHE